MADRVVESSEVVLNSIKFPIDGFVRESLISRFPAVMRIGEPDYANEQILSNWIISDQRGGLLVEEMDESIHQDRYWWSTCETRYRSNILLPPLATALTCYGETSPTGNSDPGVVWNNETNAYDDDTSTASTVTVPADAWTDYLILTIGSISCRGIRYWFDVSNTTTVPNVDVDIYYGAAWHDLDQVATTTVPGKACYRIAEMASAQDVTQVRIRFQGSGGGGAEAGYIYEVDFLADDPTTFVAVAYADFNSQNYLAMGKQLFKLASTGDAYLLLMTVSATITDLLPSSDGYLLVLQGDATNYYYMSTSEKFAQTDVALANKGIRWDGKTWKMAVNGRWWYIVAPSVASPVWTAADASGGLDDYVLTPKSLDVYRDADGNLIPYCATTKGLWAYDATNALWTETEVILPEHDQTGLGLVVWQDAIHVSGGLSVKKYIAAGTATLTEVGLSQDDGLPQLRSGEIVKFIKGYNEIFALIDSTYEGTTSRSQVVSYDGRGWRTWWEATANNKNMYTGIVTSVVKHQLIFSTTDGPYSIPLYRTSPNPKKVASYAFGAAGSHITPRFDAGTKAFPKLATKLTLFLDDMSTDETVIVTYQINQAQGALTSAWTALVGAQTADGVAETAFGTNGVGIEFYDIQFRAALVRGSTTTNSPIIKGMVLSYLKLLGRKKAWSFTINTTEAGRVGSDPKTLMGALNTILGTNTLIPFTFRDGSSSADTHYCFIQPYSSFTPSGNNYQGLANITCVEV